jgi:hypothetical protein
MKRIFLIGLAILLMPWPAQAWNDKGHMVVARLAWKELTPDQRAKVLAILQKHPHYEEFLKAKRPDTIPEAEWIFMRAATWSDWVRNGPPARRRYHMGPAHYIDYPILAPGTTATPEPIPEQNIVAQIAASKVFVKNGNQEEQAIHLCWIFHLVGDIHQPLHCVTFYSDNFPEGDRGGNRSKLRIQNRGFIRLHPFWDSLLGTATTLTSLDSSISEIEALLQKQPDIIADDLTNHQKPDEWAQEGLALAKRLIYQDGKIQPANNDKKPTPEEVPVVSEDYAKESGQAARFCVAKAGKRLAATLRELLGDSK